VDFVAIDVVGIVLAIAGGLVSLRSWRLTFDEAPGSVHHLLVLGKRTRFLAMFGLLASALFALGLLFATAADLVVPLCRLTRIPTACRAAAQALVKSPLDAVALPGSGRLGRSPLELGNLGIGMSRISGVRLFVRFASSERARTITNFGTLRMHHSRRASPPCFALISPLDALMTNFSAHMRSISC